VGDPFEVGREVRVAGGALRVAAAGPRPNEAVAVVLAAHGITASHAGWRAVAREVLARRPDVSLLAPDLRGRGRSAAVGPPYGIAAHVADLLAVLDDAGVRRAVLAGHSMGAFVAARLAAERPERAGAVVLVDGGLRLPVPADVDADQVLDAVLGPAIVRLRMTFPSVDDYVAFWQAHPAFAGHWTEDVEAYVRADLAGEPGALRSIVSEAAVRTDGAELLHDEATLGALERVRAPLRLLRAPRGLLNDDNPLIPRAVLEAFAAAHPSAAVEEVPGVNHYTITLGAGAATVAAAIAAAVDDTVG
jgi:pimeloyl-ACP methyl ester carboxylesterase